jgi:hypothetical protein
MRAEELLLTESIRDTLHEGHKSVQKLASYIETPISKAADKRDHELEAAKSAVAYYVDKVFRDTAILAERLALPKLTEEIVSARHRFKDLTALRKAPRETDMECEPLIIAQQYFHSLAAMTEGWNVTGLGVFSTILANTAHILYEGKVPPKNKKAVKKEMYKVLQWAFPEAEREPPIPRPFKTFSADFGIPSLMAAAEYKYAASAKDVMTTLDAIYTDMKSYVGDVRWRNFYVVIYMTKPFYTQTQIENEFQLVRPEINWKPIVVNGLSGRRQPSSAKAR